MVQYTLAGHIQRWMKGQTDGKMDRQVDEKYRWKDRQIGHCF